MVTGDASLTALHVAREVGICDPKAPAEAPLLLDAPSQPGGALQWASARLDAAGAERHRLPFSAKGMGALAKEGHDLVVSGAGLRAACAADAETWNHLQHVRVFARMSPEDKEGVLKAMRANGRYTMMCGDGANDVGALKQAHIGLALLSGFGDMNTKKMSPEETAAIRANAAKAAQETSKALQACRVPRAPAHDARRCTAMPPPACRARRLPAMVQRPCSPPGGPCGRWRAAG